MCVCVFHCIFTPDLSPQDDPDAHLPRIVASTFLAPGGDKFYELLFYFSVYIMRRKVTTEMGTRACVCL